MKTIGVIKPKSIDRIVFEPENPKLIFGRNKIASQQEERESIGRALGKTGMEVYAADLNWPHDSYTGNNGLYIAERDFGRVAHNGNYIFGNNFVLVSEDIMPDLEKRIRDSEHFKQMFRGKEVIFVPPYKEVIRVMDGNGLRPSHLDLSIGIVPSESLLTVDENHYNQEEKLFEEIKRRFGTGLRKTRGHGFPNNYAVFSSKGKAYVITNSGRPVFSKNGRTFEVVQTDKPIMALEKDGGSIKCASHCAPTTKLWDYLGIKHGLLYPGKKYPMHEEH